MGLSLIQHKGSMVLKVYEGLQQFTVDLIFILYSLFESILIFKPFYKNVLSDGKYLVCQCSKDKIKCDQVRQSLQLLYQ
jgi:hypothetical protein